jgi:hypothetical protein
MKSSLRGFSGSVAGAAFVAFAWLAANCQPTGGDQMGGGNGGTSGGSGGDNSGGNSNTGGSSNTNSSGGNSNTGGSSNTDSSGGSSNTGGTTNKGGSNSGGTTSRGGSGGTTSRGGSGGSSSSGGSNSGGTTSNGGTSASGGTTTTPTGGTTTSATKNSGSTVTFEKGKAAGAMTGYGWVALGKLDTITDPTCGASKTPITSTTPCAADPNWSGTGLCITGSCPALPASPTDQDYADNYGVVVGVNAGDDGGTGDPSMVIGQTFSTVSITTSGLPSSEVRAQIHIKGDSDSKSYCMKYSSGAMDLTKFAIDCYNTSPAQLFPAASIPNIDKVSLEAVSASTAVSVTSMCMTGITFGK